VKRAFVWYGRKEIETARTRRIMVALCRSIMRAGSPTRRPLKSLDSAFITTIAESSCQYTHPVRSPHARLAHLSNRRRIKRGAAAKLGV
jgi:hypothetical protein